MDKKTDVRDPDEKVVEIEMERLRAFSNHVETIAVIKKNSKKYNTKGCVKVMGELS